MVLHRRTGGLSSRPGGLGALSLCVALQGSQQLLNAGCGAPGVNTTFHFLCKHCTSEKLISFYRHILPSCAGPWWPRVGLNKNRSGQASRLPAEFVPPRIAPHSQSVPVLPEDTDVRACPGLPPGEGPQRNTENHDWEKHRCFTYQQKSEHAANDTILLIVRRT